MTRTRLDWPIRPRITEDRNFGRRETYRCRNEGYVITRIPEYLPEEWTVIWPRWADRFPSRFHSLKAAMKAAEDHRNHE